MLTTYLAPFVAVLGALAYSIGGNSKAQELGRIAFFCGLLATLLLYSKAIHV